MKRIFFSILTTLAFSFCQQSTVPVDKSLEFYIRFDEEQGISKAEANMYEGTLGGSKIEIKGGMQYQGVEMTLMPIQGMQYRKEFKAAFKPEHVFSWMDEKGIRQSVPLKMNTFNNFTFGSDTLRRDQAVNLRWKGDLFEKGESLVLIWENSATNQTHSMELYTTSVENSIPFAAAKISELPKGVWKLYLVRKQLVKTNQPHLYIQGKIEHYTKTRTITIL
jgi:hypothetical protein